jgi:hypothetical protein
MSAATHENIFRMAEEQVKRDTKTKGMRPIWFQNAQQTAIVNDPGKHTYTHTLLVYNCDKPDVENEQ